MAICRHTFGMVANHLVVKNGAPRSTRPIQKFWFTYSHVGLTLICPRILPLVPMPELSQSAIFWRSLMVGEFSFSPENTVLADKKMAPKPLPSNVPFALIEKSSNPPEYYIQSRVEVQKVLSVFYSLITLCRNSSTNYQLAVQIHLEQFCYCFICWNVKIMAWLEELLLVAPDWIFCQFLISPIWLVCCALTALVKNIRKILMSLKNCSCFRNVRFVANFGSGGALW